MSTGGGSASDAHLTGSSILWRLCRAIDLLNTWVARFFGATILVVTFAILYEVVARGVFNRPTIWANETSIYLSAAAYLLGGGYGLLRLGHVRIDLVYGVLSPGPRRVADIVGFICFSLYVIALIWIGTQMAWTSYLQSETTSTPWDPPIWPVKMAIPIAGLLLMLQGIVNLLRDLGLVPDAEFAR